MLQVSKAQNELQQCEYFKSDDHGRECIHDFKIQFISPTQIMPGGIYLGGGIIQYDSKHGARGLMGKVRQNLQRGFKKSKKWIKIEKRSEKINEK